MTRKHKIRVAVAVEVAEDGAAYQAHVGELPGVPFVEFEVAFRAEEQPRRSWFWNTPGDHEPAHEQVELTVAINIRERHRARTRLSARQQLTHLSRRQVKLKN